MKLNYYVTPRSCSVPPAIIRYGYAALLLPIMLIWSLTVSAQTFNPVADTDSQSDVAAGTNATLNASQWNQLFTRFDLSSVTGTVTNATLRIYQTSTSGAYTLNVNTTSTDSWTEGSTKPTVASLITSGAGRTTAGYVEINITAHVQSKMSGNKIVSLGLTTNLGTWTPFFSRQNSTNKPELVVTTSAPVGGTFNPTADTDSQSDVAAGTNATLNSSQWNHLFVRYDLSSVTGTVTNAVFRIYQTATSGAYTLNANTTSTDSWNEGGTKPTVGSLITSVAGRTTAGYIDINLTSYVQSKMSGNKIVSIGLTTSLGSWTPFFSRQNSTNKPELVITSGSSNNLTVSPGSLNFSTAASSQNVSVTSNIAWSVTDDQSWISVSPASGSNNGTVAVSVTANGGAARSGNVTISGSGITRVVTISQSGTTASLSVSPTSISYGSGAGSQNVAVTSNTSWSVSDNQSWISASPTSGTNNGTVAVSVTANTGAARNGTVTFTAGTLTQTVNISQSGATSGGTMAIGTNFWNIGWLDRLNHFQSGVNWTTTTNPWNPSFIADLAPFTNLRFMDWVPVNNSTISSWSQRVQKTADHYTSDGVAFEWMIDLCNRTNKDMWICLPHASDANFWTQLATLIKNTLNSNLKVYVEYSNETWNGGFTQFQYTIDQGVAQNLPGSNQWYKGGAYSVWQSLKIFKAFRDVFGSQMASRVVRVTSFSGNFDIFDQAYNAVVNSGTWNPNGEAADMIAVAPYVGSGLDGGSASIQSQFHTAINNTLNSYVLPAKAIANKYGKPLICYEGGQHLLNNAHLWSRNPLIYNEYLYMLDQWKLNFSFFSHYNLYSSFASGGAWGSKESASQSISQAHKYRALVDWISSNGGPPPVEQSLYVEEAGSGVSVFPNPSSGIASISVTSDYRGAVSMTVYDLTGRPLTTRKGKKEAQQIEWKLDVKDYKPGVYLIRLQAGDRYLKRLVKE